MQDLLPLSIWALELALFLLMLAGIWRTFEKAGQPGWSIFVPVYNAVCFARAAGEPVNPWAIVLHLPCFQVIGLFAVSVSLAKRFGKGVGFGVGLAVLPFVFYPWLGFRAPVLEERP